MNKLYIQLAAVMLALGLTACQPHTPSTPEQEVLNALAAFHNAEIDGDLGTIMDHYADDFTDPMGTTKAAVRGFFEMAVSSGALQNLQVDMQDAEITLGDAQAVVAPVRYVSGFGPSTYRYTLRKDADGVWRFTNSEMLP